MHTFVIEMHARDTTLMYLAYPNRQKKWQA